MSERKRKFFLKQIAEQEKWIAECGGDLAGYIEKYHVKYKRKLGNAEDIYRADVAFLQTLKDQLVKA